MTMAEPLLSVKVEGVEQLKKSLGSAFTPDARQRMMREIGFNVQERTADHVAEASVTRHRTADIGILKLLRSITFICCYKSGSHLYS